MRALKLSDSGGMTYKRQVISNAPANHFSVFSVKEDVHPIIFLMVKFFSEMKHAMF